MELLSIVKDVFEISGRGLVGVPGIPLTCEFVMQLGDALLLKRPDGTEASTRVTGIEMSSGPKPLPFQAFVAWIAPHQGRCPGWYRDLDRRPAQAASCSRWSWVTSTVCRADHKS